MLRAAVVTGLLGLLTGSAAAEEDGLSHAQVAAAMRPYTSAFRTCAERQRALAHQVRGRMEVAFTVGSRGGLERFEVLTPEHRGSFAAGCVAGVLRSVKFPAFRGEPVLIPRLPVELGEDESPPPEVDPDDLPPPPPEASKKARAEVEKRLKGLVEPLRACAREQLPEPAPRKAKKKKKPAPPSVGPLQLELVINPLGRAERIEVLTPAHRKDHVAGCATGLLLFAEFPPQGAETLGYPKLALPRL
jgi:hypothetical protein